MAVQGRQNAFEDKFYPTNSALAEEISRLFGDACRRKMNSHEEEDDWAWNGIEVDPLEGEWVPIGRPVLKRNKKKKLLPTECVFCRNNREEPAFYKNHVLKDRDGRVVCPVLRVYICPICKVSGDSAHTLKYCPMNQGQLSTMGSVKTHRTSTGKRIVNQ